VPYDFRHPTKLSRDHARGLQIVYETFARQWATQMTASLRTTASIDLNTIEQRSYGAFVAGLPEPTFMAMFTAPPLQGQCVVQFDLAATMGFVDRMLGGPGGAAQPKRQPSNIEVLLLRQLLDRMLRELRYSFAQVVDITCEVGGIETNPQFAQAAALTDIMVVAEFSIRIGPAATSSLTTASIALPFESIEAHMRPTPGDASPAAAVERHRQQALTTSGINGTPVDVGVRLSSVRMGAKELLSLTTGDIVRIAHPTARPLTIVVGDVPVARAVVGGSGTRLACLVVDPKETVE